MSQRIEGRLARDPGGGLGESHWLERSYMDVRAGPQAEQEAKHCGVPLGRRRRVSTWMCERLEQTKDYGLDRENGVVG
jgi:hypothetical protein